MPRVLRSSVLVAACLFLICSTASAQSGSGITSQLDRSIATAEASLKDGELELAESHYRDAILEGWMTIGALNLAESRLPEAKDAFTRAAASAVEKRTAIQALALVELRMGEADRAVERLTRLLGPRTDDVPTLRLLAQALVANGHPEQAVQQLETAHGAAPDDVELTFVLASGYLRLKKVAAAETLFASVAKLRPLPQTYVLIGRAYRDAGEYDRARAALTTGLSKDRRVRRAHYYLGTIAVLSKGVAGLDEAISEFQQEFALAPDDPVTNLRLGMALVEAQRPQDALTPLQVAVRASPPQADAFHYLGRCQLALEHPAEAVAALRRALELSQGNFVDQLRLLGIHYQLAQALRKVGDEEEAARQFAEAEHLSAQRADTSRERLTRYMSDAQDAQDVQLPLASIDVSPLASLPDAQRTELRRQLTTALARAYLNLGIMQMQSKRFSRAAEMFELAATADPDFPQVQYSLGIARFNAQQYAGATAPLSRVLAVDPGNRVVRRMLAMAWFNSGTYDKAAELLRDDPERATDVSLQYAYGLALVRSDRAEEAEAVFARLIAEHGTTPELNVVLGQAHAQQGDFESAIASLQRALQMKPDAAEANTTLGIIYLKQGKLDEAASALRTELAHHPDDTKAAHTLATVLDLQGKQDEAVAILRAVLKTRPDFADARYLLGKVLLSQGAAAEAIEHLEAAARLAPEDANIHYQLAQAYQKVGRPDLAEQRFELYRQLKDKRRSR
jgi:tetratricopeptide (TPR) repeat protein